MFKMKFIFLNEVYTLPDGPIIFLLLMVTKFATNFVYSVQERFNFGLFRFSVYWTERDQNSIRQTMFDVYSLYQILLKSVR